MKNLLIILSLMCFFSCKNDTQEIAKDLQKTKWNVSGWLGKDKMKFTQAGDKPDWQAAFLPNGRLVQSFLMAAPDTMFDAHGNELDPGTMHADSCYTYEVKNNIIKISSHGHGAEDSGLFYKLTPEQKPDFTLTQVTKRDF